MILKSGERFRQSRHARVHADTVLSEPFLAAAEAALLAYQQDMPTAIGPEEARNSFYKLAGAREFLYVLLNLAETPENPKPAGANKLRHDV